MAKPAFRINSLDIAAANLAFQIVQNVIDVLVERKILAAADVLTLYRDMAAYHSQPGPADRAEIKAAAANVLAMIATRYDVPPPREQH